jgi:hypothetical protein
MLRSGGVWFSNLRCLVDRCSTPTAIRKNVPRSFCDINPRKQPAH